MSTIDDRAVARRMAQIARGQRDPRRDYENACLAVSEAHAAYKKAQTKTGVSQAAQDRYSLALQELDICVHVLEISQAA